MVSVSVLVQFAGAPAVQPPPLTLAVFTAFVPAAPVMLAVTV